MSIKTVALKKKNSHVNDEQETWYGSLEIHKHGRNAYQMAVMGPKNGIRHLVNMDYEEALGLALAVARSLPLPDKAWEELRFHQAYMVGEHWAVAEAIDRRKAGEDI